MRDCGLRIADCGSARSLLGAAFVVLACAAANGQVVRPAPNFGVEAVARGSSLRSFRGQTVVVVFGRSAREKEFRTEVSRLGELYGEFSNEKVVFVAAIENGPESVQSNIPFMMAANPQQVAADYGVTGRYALAVIGTDGNLDMITSRLIAPERVRDVVFNNYESQAGARKPLGQ